MLSADLDSGGDTLTYTSVAAGVDGQHRRPAGSPRRSATATSADIDWNDDVADRDVHSGLAAVTSQIVPGVLTFDAGALATRTGGDGRASSASPTATTARRRL